MKPSSCRQSASIHEIRSILMRPSARLGWVRRSDVWDKLHVQPVGAKVRVPQESGGGGLCVWSRLTFSPEIRMETAEVNPTGLLLSRSDCTRSKQLDHLRSWAPLRMSSWPKNLSSRTLRCCAVTNIIDRFPQNQNKWIKIYINKY